MKVTISEAQSVAKSFMLQNSTLLGVRSSEGITFSRSDSSVLQEGSAEWYLTTDLQNYGGLEVYDTSINFIITDGKVISCA